MKLLSSISIARAFSVYRALEITVIEEYCLNKH